MGYGGPPRRRTPIWLGAVAAAVVGLAGFGITVATIVASQPHHGSGPPPTVVGTGNTPPTPSPPPTDDPRFARPGDCVAITSPPARIVPCGTPDGYLVLERIDGTADFDRCAAVPGSNAAVRYEDGVLCLRR